MFRKSLILLATTAILLPMEAVYAGKMRSETGTHRSQTFQKSPKHSSNSSRDRANVPKAARHRARDEGRAGGRKHRVATNNRDHVQSRPVSKQGNTAVSRAENLSPTRTRGVNQPVIRQNSRPVQRPTNRSSARAEDRMEDRVTRRSNTRSERPSAQHATSRPLNQAVSRSGRLNQPVSRSGRRSVDHARTPVDRKNHAKAGRRAQNNAQLPLEPIPPQDRSNRLDPDVRLYAASGRGGGSKGHAGNRGRSGGHTARGSGGRRNSGGHSSSGRTHRQSGTHNGARGNSGSRDHDGSRGGRGSRDHSRGSYDGDRSHNNARGHNNNRDHDRSRRHNGGNTRSGDHYAGSQRTHYRGSYGHNRGYGAGHSGLGAYFGFGHYYGGLGFGYGYSSSYGYGHGYYSGYRPGYWYGADYGFFGDWPLYSGYVSGRSDWLWNHGHQHYHYGSYCPNGQSSRYSSTGYYSSSVGDNVAGVFLGGVVGGIIGAEIDGGHNRTAGAVIGSVVGAAIGAQATQSNSNNYQAAGGYSGSNFDTNGRHRNETQTYQPPKEVRTCVRYDEVRGNYVCTKWTVEYIYDETEKP